MLIRIRPMIEQDLPAITIIYNDAIKNSLAIWHEQATTIEERRQWWQQRLNNNFPVLAAVDAGNQMIGYASFGSWRLFDGYRYTVEHSIYVAANQRQQGIGQQLLMALIAQARQQRLHVMVAAIEANNYASIKLHERFAFVQRGYLPQVGFKFGRWLDLILMQLNLTAQD